MTISFKVNGEARSLDIDPETPLLWALRDELRLTGSKFGCGVAQCGACTVHVNGNARRSCVTPVGSLEGAEIVTIEGLSGREADALLAAWREHDAPQCGYCQSGQIMTAAALLARKPGASDADIDNALAGNICRCAAYVRIKAAVKSAAATLEG